MSQGDAVWRWHNFHSGWGPTIIDWLARISTNTALDAPLVHAGARRHRPYTSPRTIFGRRACGYAFNHFTVASGAVPRLQTGIFLTGGRRQQLRAQARRGRLGRWSDVAVAPPPPRLPDDPSPLPPAPGAAPES
jgi:hypothetical protein